MSMFTSNVSPAVSCQFFERSIVWLKALTEPVGMRMLETFMYDCPAKSLLSNRMPSGSASSIAASEASQMMNTESNVTLRNVTVMLFNRHAEYKRRYITIRISRNHKLLRWSVERVREVNRKGVAGSGHDPCLVSREGCLHRTQMDLPDADVGSGLWVRSK